MPVLLGKKPNSLIPPHQFRASARPLPPTDNGGMNITVHSSFEALPEAARQRWGYPSQANFFLSLDWFRVLAETALPNTVQLRLYLVSDAQGEPLSVLACYAEHGRRNLHSLTNFYSNEFSPSLLNGASDSSSILSAVMTYIAAERPAWQRIDLRVMRSNEPVFEDMQQALRQQGFAVHRYFQYENWFIRTAGTNFDTYFAARPSQLRNTVSRRERKLKREHECHVEIFSAPSPELEAALAHFMTVYQGSWKQPEPYPDFIAALARNAARCGVLRLGVLTLGGQPAAAQLWVTSGGRAMIYKLAYDEKYRDLSVGSVLSSALFRQALDEDQVSEIDYGVGSEPYKRDWMTEVRHIEGLVAFNTRTLSGRLQALVESAKRAVQRLRTRFKH